MPSEKPNVPKPLPSVHLLGSGTPMCAGCGGLEAVHEVYDILGAKTVFVNAAGCLTLLATYPFTPFRGSWLYTAMASAPAGAQGVRDALDVLLAKGRIPPEEDLEVVVLSGDGSAYGMGLSATSSAIERGLNFLYLCYDNEGFGNTGQQYSEATPHAAHTATSLGRAGFTGYKKDLFAIWTAHRPGLRRHGRGGRTPGPHPQDREGQGPQRPAPDPDPGPLPAGLGLRPAGRGGDRQAGGQNRPLAPEGIRGRPGDAHQNPPSPPAGGGISATAGALRPPLPPAAQRRPHPRYPGPGGRLLGRGELNTPGPDSLTMIGRRLQDLYLPDLSEANTTGQPAKIIKA